MFAFLSVTVHMVLIIFLGCSTRPSTQYLPWPSQLAQSTISTSPFSKVLFQICSIASLRVPDVNSIKIIFHSFSFRFPFRFRLDFGLSTVVTGARNGFSTPFAVRPLTGNDFRCISLSSFLFICLVSRNGCGNRWRSPARALATLSLAFADNMPQHWPLANWKKRRKQKREWGRGEVPPTEARVPIALL